MKKDGSIGLLWGRLDKWWNWVPDSVPPSRSGSGDAGAFSERSTFCCLWGGGKPRFEVPAFGDNPRVFVVLHQVLHSLAPIHFGSLF